MNHRLRTSALVGAAVLTLAGSACSAWNDDRGIGDAPVDQQDDTTVKVWPNADRFPNISVICVGGNGVYSTTREAPPAVVPNDPECASGGVVSGSGGDPEGERSTAEEDSEDN